MQCGVETLAEAIQKEDPYQARDRLSEIDQELENLARFVAKTGKVDAAAALLRRPPSGNRICWRTFAQFRAAPPPRLPPVKEPEQRT